LPHQRNEDRPRIALARADELVPLIAATGELVDALRSLVLRMEADVDNPARRLDTLLVHENRIAKFR
jgi:hypothetical protein